MPLAAIAINSFDAKLMRETTQDNELKIRLEKLYEDDKRLHDFNGGKEAIQHFEQTFDEGQKIYVGIFNDKPICAVESQLDMRNQTLNLVNLAMHTQNLNRGIELQFINLIRKDIERNNDKKPLLTSNKAEIKEWIELTSKRAARDK